MLPASWIHHFTWGTIFNYWFHLVFCPNSQVGQQLKTGGSLRFPPNTRPTWLSKTKSLTLTAVLRGNNLEVTSEVVQKKTKISFLFFSGSQIYVLFTMKSNFAPYCPQNNTERLAKLLKSPRIHIISSQLQHPKDIQQAYRTVNHLSEGKEKKECKSH